MDGFLAVTIITTGTFIGVRVIYDWRFVPRHMIPGLLIGVGVGNLSLSGYNNSVLRCIGAILIVIGLILIVKMSIDEKPTPPTNSHEETEPS